MTSSGRRRPLWAVAAPLVMAAGLLLSARGVAGDALPEAIAQQLRKHRIPESTVSLVVREMDGDARGNATGNTTGNATLLRLNLDTPRNPASVIKLLTTLAALELLGPGYQWQTAYFADGVIEDGVLRGDLIFKGGGDPFLTVERLLGDVLALRQRGLETIAGQLVIDNSRFAPAPHDRDAFDGKAQRLYNVGPDAALVNFSVTHFVIEPHGNEIRVRAEPPLAGLNIVNGIKARSGKCTSPNAGWSYRLKNADEPVGKNLTASFRGTYRTRCGSHSISHSLLPNNDYTYRLFVALWRAMGGQLDGGYRVSSTPAGTPTDSPESAQLLLMRPSEPLADIITGINKFSNNVMSRQLLLTIGAELHGEPGTVAGGIGVIKNWLAVNGIAMPALIMENGSGLSRKSRLSAGGLSALLKRGWDSTYRPEFVSSLPLAAIDGTLRKRLNSSPLRGRARIKTGLIDGVRSMAGYVHARNNRHYSVVLMIDSGRVNFWNGNALQDAVLRWVYHHD